MTLGKVWLAAPILVYLALVGPVFRIWNLSAGQVIGVRAIRPVGVDPRRLARGSWASIRAFRLSGVGRPA